MLLLMYGSVLGWEFEKLRMEWAFENCKKEAQKIGLKLG